MMKAALFFIGCVATSAQAQNVAPSTTPDVDLRFTFLTALKATAGDEAIGCGLGEFNAASATEFGCAESALNDGKPFWLAVKTDSSDANKWSAAARNKAGTLFFVTSRTGGVSRDPKKNGDLKFENQQVRLVQISKGCVATYHLS